MTAAATAVARVLAGAAQEQPVELRDVDLRFMVSPVVRCCS
jgi:hypothetical protein